MSFLYGAHCHDFFYISVKYYEKGIQAYQKRHKGDMSQRRKVRITLMATNRHDLSYRSAKYHDNVPKGIQVTEDR